MTDDNWDEFTNPLDRRDIKGQSVKESPSSGEKQDDDNQLTGCDWGQSEPVVVDERGHQYGDNDQESSKFIPIYERYLDAKGSIVQETKNFKLYSRNPQKYLREWFDYQGHEFKVDSDQPSEKQYICSIDLPIDEHEFTITSELHATKKSAIDEVCLDACRMLDDCQLLCSNASSSSGADQREEDNDVEDFERKRRIDEANKEDDIVFDSTKWNDVKRHCNEPEARKDQPSSSTGSSSSIKAKVNTYESLMAQWRETNMAILQLKAKLVKLDLSISGSKPKGVAVERQTSCSNDKLPPENNSSEEDEIDPLDEFMSNMDKKTALSMDEKIEKSRIKSQIATYEKDQTKLERLIELAKPSIMKT